ncbi:fumarate hydratase [Cupriavidus pauculus]|uniref:Fumarate hydratase class I n=1 Tax=Cupriavidus pauculus TaxID=82633 RepID=A0A5P2HET1_9BURK|nr:fumarate hydratase [Cupriavidus pauculus]QET05540.1 fumarate hydratase [Cupriavidus pauculus]
MTVVYQEDIADSVADALQFISYYHPADFVEALRRAWEAEPPGAARSALTQLLVNSRMAARGHRPLCQDTGVAQVFLSVGMDVRLATRDGSALRSLQDVVNDGVRRAYTLPANPLRATMVASPLGARRNTGDNTPGFVDVELVPGNTVEMIVVAKGGGGDVKAKFTTLNPSDSLVDWILDAVPQMGAGWCPPGVLGVGIGGTPEQAMRAAKRSLFAPIDIQTVRARGANDDVEALRLALHDRINALGIGAQGLGGLTTVLDVKVGALPSHAAALPVALIPNCAATRFVRCTLDGNGPATFTPPDPSLWRDIPDAMPEEADALTVDLDTLTADTVAQWKVGQTLRLRGRLLTARDAAHKRLMAMLDAGEPLPVPLRDRTIYYVGPVDPVGDEAVGPAGPTTATRMDKFLPRLLAETGLRVMVGKAERGPAAIDAIRDNGAAYLTAVGGAAYLISRAIRKSRVVAFPDLGMEAMYEFEVEDMPVTVAVDARGRSIHTVFQR